MQLGQPLEGRGRLGVQAPRDAPGEPGQMAALDSGADRERHRDRVLGARDRARAQHRVAAELHRQRRVGCGADAGVEDHRHTGALR